MHILIQRKCAGTKYLVHYNDACSLAGPKLAGPGSNSANYGWSFEDIDTVDWWIIDLDQAEASTDLIFGRSKEGSTTSQGQDGVLGGRRGEEVPTGHYSKLRPFTGYTQRYLHTLM